MAKTRDIYFTCTATRGKELINEQIKVQDPTAADRGKAEAEEAFKAQHNLNSKSTLGPFYEVKGAANAQTDRMAITLDSKNFVFTGSRFTGVFHGWKIVGNGLKALKHGETDYADNELIVPMFEELADADKARPKPRLSRNAVIRASDVENLQAA